VDTSGGAVVTGRDWSPLFRPLRTEHSGSRTRIEAADDGAGLRLVTEVESVPGGAIRARHTLTNAGRLPYAVAALEVVFPLPASAAEILDFSGRHLFERTPQRHQVTDGLWLREGRRGRTGHDAGHPGDSRDARVHVRPRRGLRRARGVERQHRALRGADGVPDRHHRRRRAAVRSRSACPGWACRSCGR
jgi:hypothetical protein